MRAWSRRAIRSVSLSLIDTGNRQEIRRRDKQGQFKESDAAAALLAPETQFPNEAEAWRRRQGRPLKEWEKDSRESP